MTAIRTFSISLLLLLVTVFSIVAQERRTIVFSFENVKLGAACDTLIRRYGVPLVYLDTMLASKTVSAVCSGCMEEEALTTLLAGTGITWRKTAGQFMLVELSLRPPVSYGTVAGSI